MEELRLTSTIAHTYFGSRDARYNQRYHSPEPFTISTQDFAKIEALCRDKKYMPFSWRERGTETIRIEHELAWVFQKLKTWYALLDYEVDKQESALTDSFNTHEGRKKGVDQFFKLPEICDFEQLKKIQFIPEAASKEIDSIESPELIKFICDAIKYRYEDGKKAGSPYYSERLHFVIERKEQKKGRRTLVIGRIHDDRLKDVHAFCDFMREEVAFGNPKRKPGQADPYFAFGAKLFFLAGVPYSEDNIYHERPEEWHKGLIKQFQSYYHTPLPERSGFFWGSEDSDTI